MDESSGGRVRGHQTICARLGVAEKEAAPAFRQLVDAGYLTGTLSSADLPLVIESTEKGLQYCSGWPSAGESSTFIENFLDAVRARADDAAAPEEERGRLSRFTKAASEVGTKALTDIAAAVIAHKLPM